MANPILDKDFLKKLYADHNHEVFAKISALTFDELLTEEIQGRITSGSINVDGTSAVRRSCSLTLVAEDVNINDYYWGLNTKFKLEVGLKNRINSEYPDIIWFKQGTYLITSFSTSYTTNNYQISISGKDKMCLLNGDVGGTLNASIDFGKEEYYDNTTGETTYELMEIGYIVREAVHEYAHEPWENIVVEIDETPLELLDYTGLETMYLIFGQVDGSDVAEVVGYTFDGNTKVLVDGVETNISEVKQDPRVDIDFNDNGAIEEGQKFKLPGDASEKEYTSAKVETYHTCGYRSTTLTYPGDLIASIGESLTSILDKIVAFLGHYEYFYDLDGRFVFRRAHTWIGKNWSSIITDSEGERYADSAAGASPNAWDISDSELITSFNNTPNLLNLRNDFTIWGTKPGVGDQELPVHLRYAIDTKPGYYKTQSGIEYMTSGEEKLRNSFGVNMDDDVRVVDWREIIYQMAIDYRQHNHDDEFHVNLRNINGKNVYGEWVYPTGYTGYEQYYIDMEGFWRQLYCPADEFYQVYATINDYQNYYLRYKLENFEDSSSYEYSDSLYGYVKPQEGTYSDLFKYYKKGPANESPDDGVDPGWFSEVVSNPEKLFFWFDFLDDGGILEKYNIHSIGDRSKAVNDDKVKAIYFREVPTTIFYESGTNPERHYGYTYMQYPKSLEGLFAVSSQGKSAIDVLHEFLYKYSYCIESASISTVPLYHLEPNIQIHIEDKNSGISGNYTVSKFTIPLVYNGTMSITATKAMDNIY